MYGKNVSLKINEKNYKGVRELTEEKFEVIPKETAMKK